MSNTAHLVFDPRSNKYRAIYAGKLIAASQNKDYVITSIRSGRCTKANQLKVTDILVPSEASKTAAGGKAVPTEKFSINQRFEFTTDFVNMVIEREAASVVITGEGGLGKTFTVLEALDAAGMINTASVLGEEPDEDAGEEEDAVAARYEKLAHLPSQKLYTVIKGFSTARGLFRTLYQNRNRICVFDDCDSILKDPVARNLLKGALDSYDRRFITWNTDKEDDIPSTFEFTGGIIFISNLSIFTIDQAIISRSIPVDLSMTMEQKIERMEVIIKSDKFMPEFEFDTKRAALSFIESILDQLSSLNMRSLIQTTRIAARGGSWQARAEYTLTAI